MDTRVYPAMGEVKRLRDTTWQAIGTATVDGAERLRSWNAWTDHNLSLYGTCASDQKQVTTDKLLTFDVAMWEGKYGLGSPVKVQTAKRAPRHVAQKFILDGQPDPENLPQPSNPSTSPLPN